MTICLREAGCGLVM